MTDQQSTADGRTAPTTQASDVSVTMIATPGDASCGIGTYGRDLRKALDDVEREGPADDSEDTSDPEGSAVTTAGDGGVTTEDVTGTSVDDTVAKTNGGTGTASGGVQSTTRGETTERGEATKRGEATTADSAGSNATGRGADPQKQNGVGGQSAIRSSSPAYSGAATDAIEIEQDEPSALHFVSVALRAAFRGSDVVHVQHEYGLFRQPGSIYPGVLGLVFFPVLWLATRVRGQAITVTMHSVLTPSPAEARFSKRLYLFVMHELIARVADHVIFLSEDCEERFHDDVAQDPDSYSVLPHGVNVEDASSADRASAREYFGFDTDDDIVAIPGFVRPPKGHDVFIEVARELPDVEFLIAGGARPKGFDQEFFEDLQSAAPPNVTITGVLDDDEFPLALATPDLALLPYRVVSQSGTFNWCAAQELPILTSDQSYFRQIESEWGALETVPIDDVETIAERVERLLADDRRRTELSGNVRRYKDANSFETVAGQHLRIYRSVLGDAPDRTTVVDDADEASTEDETPLLAACSAQRDAAATSD